MKCSVGEFLNGCSELTSFCSSSSSCTYLMLLGYDSVRNCIDAYVYTDECNADPIVSVPYMFMLLFSFLVVV